MTKYIYNKKITVEDGSMLLLKSSEEKNIIIDIRRVEELHVSFIGALLILKSRTDSFEIHTSNNVKKLFNDFNLNDYFKEVIK
jgi:hypothetical protein